MFAEIGSYDAKTKLPELLREVQGGQRFTITLRGKPVADLVPSIGCGSSNIRAAVDAMRSFNKIRGVDGVAVADWIAEGRR